MSSVDLQLVQEIVRQLTTAVANAALYSPEHEQVARRAQDAARSLASFLAAEPELNLLSIDDQLVCADRPLPASLYASRFIRHLQGHGIGHLKVLAGVTTEEIAALVRGLSLPGGSEELHSSEHLRLGRVETPSATAGESGRAAGSLKLPELPAAEAARLGELVRGVRKGEKLRVAGIAEMVACFVNAFSGEAGPLLALAPLRALDEYTFTHSTNVCVLNLAQAMSLGIEGQLLHDIGIAAMLHDVGKLFLPEELLKNSDKLNEEEWALIRRHPQQGARYLLDVPGVPRLAVVTAFEHHLGYDQSGYPEVARDWQQNLCSQMTTVSDVFDALRTRRAYRGALAFGEVKGIMQAMAGTTLHPVLTANFLRLLERLAA